MGAGGGRQWCDEGGGGEAQDNILTQVMNNPAGASYDDLFSAELAKYHPICAQIAKNVEAQDALLQQIKVRVPRCRSATAALNGGAGVCRFKTMHLRPR